MLFSQSFEIFKTFQIARLVKILIFFSNMFFSILQYLSPYSFFFLFKVSFCLPKKGIWWVSWEWRIIFSATNLSLICLLFCLFAGSFFSFPLRVFDLLMHFEFFCSINDGIWHYLCNEIENLIVGWNKRGGWGDGGGGREKLNI